MKKVYICSPLGGDVSANLERAKQYARYVFSCGAAPVVPHFYALVLEDGNPEERQLGMQAGRSLLWLCDELWIFGDHVSAGMPGGNPLLPELRSEDPDNHGETIRKRQSAVKCNFDTEESFCAADVIKRFLYAEGVCRQTFLPILIGG